MADDQLRSIQEYVFAKYIEGGGAPAIDEIAAVDYLESYFASPEGQADPDCFYLGILYFELGWEDEDKQQEYFEKAKLWLERYRALSGDEDWDAIDDRLLDLDEYFEERGIEVETPEMPEAAPVEAPVVVEEVEDHGPMLVIAGGTFLFGKAREPVNLPTYKIDKYPVTNKEYEAFCRATGYRFPKKWNDKRFNAPSAPVVGVSFADAQKYSRWVGKELPTEEQWEKACRGVDGRDLPWGEDDVTDSRACFGRDPAEGSTDPVEKSVDSTSPYGVRDLIGNVWEWTSTADEDGETIHVIKGCCYNDPADFLSATIRLGAGPKDKFETIGFRCVKKA